MWVQSTLDCLSVMHSARQRLQLTVNCMLHLPGLETRGGHIFVEQGERQTVPWGIFCYTLLGGFYIWQQKVCEYINDVFDIYDTVRTWGSTIHVAHTSCFFTDAEQIIRHSLRGALRV